MGKTVWVTWQGYGRCMKSDALYISDSADRVEVFVKANRSGMHTEMMRLYVSTSGFQWASLPVSSADAVLGLWGAGRASNQL